MCGIAGFFGGDFKDADKSYSILKSMADSIASRGPDSSGYWLDSTRKVGFAHRRLSIVDLTEAGHQPMISHSKRYVLIFNGEIYNHIEIRSELSRNKAKLKWKGHSDTETLLAAFDYWGIKKTICRIKGMFAIAVWDQIANELVLIRDRLGEKPLYYGWQGAGKNKVFLFGSELKALKRHPSFENIIDKSSLSLYLRYSYVPAPYSIYKGIKKLTPGSILTISFNDNYESYEKYWDAVEVIKSGNENPFHNDAIEITNNLEIKLIKTISQQMIADVPLGAFLSGGVDSSTVVALMQAQSSRPIKTFTIGFEESSFNEAEFAKLVANHLKTEHTELYVSPKDAMEVIPKLPSLYCEPFADSSQIPTFLVSSLARQHVTVSLSGDGGDELFCGYNRYLFAHKLWKSISVAPVSLRKVISDQINRVPTKYWNNLFYLANKFSMQGFNAINWGDKLLKGAAVISSEDFNDLYNRLVSNWQHPSSVVKESNDNANSFSITDASIAPLNSIKKMMLADIVTYLPDDILVKVDRAAMGVSLETRVPFLDHDIFEFASKIPLEANLNRTDGKLILRNILYKYVPKELIERPKMGFGVPIGSWLRDPLKEWAETLLNEDFLIRQGLFHADVIKIMWSEHLSGIRNWQSQLWAVLIFQAWYIENEKENQFN